MGRQEEEGMSEGTVHLIQELRRQIDKMRSGHSAGWTHQIPTKTGMYLRLDPSVRTIIQHKVFVGNGLMVPKGSLCVHIDGKYVELEKWASAGKMWWYGPIPDPPEES